MEGPRITGNFKISIGRPETVVPTGAGLRTKRMAEEFDLPYFAKATKGFSLSSALVTEEFDVPYFAKATKGF